MNGMECYMYDPDYCDGKLCVGNCDECPWAERDDDE